MSKATRGTRTETLTLRITPDIREKLQRAQSALPYPLTATSIIERGIELAAQELEQMAENSKAGAS